MYHRKTGCPLLNNLLHLLCVREYKVFEFDCRIICLSDKEKKKYTLEYKNNKDKFKYIEEVINNKDHKKKSLKEKAKELFD